MGRTSKNIYKKYTEQDLAKAVELVNKGLSLGKAAKMLKIPKYTIKGYIDGKYTLGKKGRQPLSIPPHIENNIVRKTLYATSCGFLVTKHQLLTNVGKVAKKLGLKTQFKNFMPGNDYWKGLKSRHTELSVRIPESCTSNRLSMLNPTVVGNYFTALEETIDRLELRDKPAHIWNCDETNMMFAPDHVKVIDQRGKRNFVAKANNTRESVSVLVTVNAVGDVMPPLCVVKGKTMASAQSFACDEAPKGTCWTHQDNAYMTDVLGYEWFRKVFLQNCGPAWPQLLILDSNSSHEVLELLQTAKEENIEILALPPHTTSKLQPLDVSIFGPLKANYKKVCTEFLTADAGNFINKRTWPGLLKQAWDDVMRPSLIQKAFKATGIFPFNPRVITEEDLLPSTALDRAPRSDTVSNNDGSGNREKHQELDPHGDHFAPQMNTLGADQEILNLDSGNLEGDWEADQYSDQSALHRDLLAEAINSAGILALDVNCLD